MLTAQELHRRGVEAVNHGRVRLASRLLERARQRTSDPDVRARIEVSQAYVAMELGNQGEATRLCVDALSAPGLADADRGVALSQLAMLQMRAGNASEALESFTAGISLLHDLPRDLAQAFGNRGDVYLHQGSVEEAISDFREAARHFAAIDARVDQAKAEHNLGYALLVGGDIVGALRAMESAYPVVSPVSPVLRAICEQDRAEALLAAGLVAEGTTLLRSAVRSYGARRLRQRQGEAELALARRLLLSDPGESLRIARLARRRFERLQADSWRVRADAATLAAEVELGRRAGTLVARGEELVSALKRQGLPWAAMGVEHHVVRVLARNGDLASARQRLHGSRVDRRAPMDVRLLARDVRAEVAERQGRPADALAHLRTGLEDLHAWQSSFGSLDLQTNVVGHGTQLAVRGLELAAASRSPDVLFEWSERARMLASRVQPVRAPQDEQTTADLTELRSGPTPEREAELRRRVREQAWQREGSGEVADPVRLAELQATLDADTALVAYVVTADRVVALVVTDRAALRHDLGDREPLERLLGGLHPDLDVAAADLPASMAGVVRQELNARLERLAALLVDPLLEHVGERRVVLTPSGVLAGVPWTLLPGLRGRPVTVARSATSWLARSTTSPVPRTAGLVAGPRVPRADAEVTAAARAWGNGAQTLTGPGATATAVSELAGRVDVLHVAAHGRHSAENPLFSALELADGSWFGYDIDQLPAVPGVVLLSACELGRSSVRHREELIGMTSAWLHAGARWVVASPTAVNDAAAHDAFVSLHGGLRAGLEPPAALAALRAAPEAAPAPFVCFA